VHGYPLFPVRRNSRLEIIESIDAAGSLCPRRKLFLSLIALGCKSTEVPEAMKQLDLLDEEKAQAVHTERIKQRDALAVEIGKLKAEVGQLEARRWQSNRTHEDHAAVLAEKVKMKPSKREEMIAEYLRDAYTLSDAEEMLARAYAEIRKQVHGTKAVFDEEIVELAKNAEKK
jgi:hypothetical protein